MTYLARPRINFFGKSYSNPSTANNNDFAEVFDVDTLQFKPTMTVIPPATVERPEPPAQQFEWSGSQDNPALRKWLMGKLTGIKKQDGGPDGQQAHWNYYGDHATEFRETFVTTIVPSGPAPVPAGDPLLGAKVEILGDVYYEQRKSPVIVDVDPLGLVTSQIFTGQLKVTAPDGTPLIEAEPPTRAFSYFINPFKMLDPSARDFQPVSAIFIFSVPKGAGLKINPAAVASPALAELAAAVASGAGLNVRYCFYDAIYKLTPEQRYDDFTKQNYVVNPYLGKVLGTIGVLRAAELASAPMGRKLYVETKFEYTPPVPSAPLASAAAPIRVHRYRHSHDDAEAQKNAWLGPALAEVDQTNTVIALDLSSTFPEDNVETRTKMPLGQMQLRIEPASGMPLVIGEIPNTKESYEAGGGVVEISYRDSPDRAAIDAALAKGHLAIWSHQYQKDLLAEVQGIDIQTDDRAVYLEERLPPAAGGSGAIPGTATVRIQAFERGRPLDRQATINLEYWMCSKDYINPNKPIVPVPSPYFAVAGATRIADTVYPNRYPTQTTGAPPTISVITEQVTVPAGGALTLNLTALRPGVSMIRFVDPAISQVVPNFAWDNCDFSIVRILPYDDYSSYPDAVINDWKFIYDHFFGYFSVMYPVMSKVMPWGPDNAPNDPPEVRKVYADLIRTFTDEKMWESTLYMPITREMSAGKRALIQRWCNLQL